MAYTTKDLVKAEFKALEIKASGSAILEADADKFIAQSDAYINARLKRRYTVPIVEATSPNSYLIVQQISTYYVAQRIKEILEVKQAQPEGTQEVRGANLRKIADGMIKQILDGDLDLDDAISVSNGGVDSFNARVGECNTFKKHEDQY